jgi:multidrug efflux pump subunit AcrA (membrane-fusion protein)
MKQYSEPMHLALIIAALAALSASLTACGSAVTPTPIVAPPTSSVEPNAPAAGTVTASGVVVPAQVSEMGFFLSAPVREVNVSEGIWCGGSNTRRAG